MTVEIVEPGVKASALERWEEIAERLRDGDPVIFLDYDGTVAPLTPVPHQAVLSDEMRDVLRRLMEHCPVALVSSRDLRDLRRMVDIDGLIYLTNGGFEVIGPHGHYVQNEGKSFGSMLDSAESELRYAIGNIRGALVERRRFAVALHHRLVDPKDMPRLMEVFERVARRHPELRVVRGRRACRLRPDVDWDRGQAVGLVLNTLKLDGSVPIYIGDDRADEAAFKTIGERGITVLVTNEVRETNAQYVLEDFEEVRQFLEKVIEVLEER